MRILLLVAVGRPASFHGRGSAILLGQRVEHIVQALMRELASNALATITEGCPGDSREDIRLDAVPDDVAQAVPRRMDAVTDGNNDQVLL